MTSHLVIVEKPEYYFGSSIFSAGPEIIKLQWNPVRTLWSCGNIILYHLVIVEEPNYLGKTNAQPHDVTGNSLICLELCLNTSKG